MWRDTNTLAEQDDFRVSLEPGFLKMTATYLPGWMGVMELRGIGLVTS